MNNSCLTGFTTLMLATTAGGAHGDENTAIAALKKRGTSITRDQSRSGNASPALVATAAGGV
jgi:hypothetical protein